MKRVTWAWSHLAGALLVTALASRALPCTSQTGTADWADDDQIINSYSVVNALPDLEGVPLLRCLEQQRWQQQPSRPSEPAALPGSATLSTASSGSQGEQGWTPLLQQQLPLAPLLLHLISKAPLWQQARAQGVAVGAGAVAGIAATVAATAASDTALAANGQQEELSATAAVPKPAAAESAAGGSNDAAGGAPGEQPALGCSGRKM